MLSSVTLSGWWEAAPWPKNGEKKQHQPKHKRNGQAPPPSSTTSNEGRVGNSTTLRRRREEHHFQRTRESQLHTHTHLEPIVKPPTTRAVTCGAMWSVGHRVFSCAFLFRMRLACAKVYLRIGRFGPTLPTHLPGPTMSPFTPLALHPTCG